MHVSLFYKLHHPLSHGPASITDYKWCMKLPLPASYIASCRSHLVIWVKSYCKEIAKRLDYGFDTVQYLAILGYLATTSYLNCH